MNRIDQLITEFCPDGVEHRPLGEVGKIIRGKRFVKADMGDEGVPCIHYGEIYTKYGTSAKESISFVTEQRAETLRFAKPGDVIMASAGETIEDIGKSVAWLGTEPIAIHDACYAFSSSMDPVFVSHFFASHNFRRQIRQKISSSKISSISTQNVAKARIPVPPLEIQREIAKILDMYSQLEAELEAELEARTQQYEHYRDRLFQEIEDREDLPMASLCGSITTGKLDVNAKVDGGLYPFFTCDAKPYAIDTYAFDTEAILLSGNGSRVGHVNYYDGKFNAYQRTYVVSDFSHRIVVRYLLHYLHAYFREYVMLKARKGSVPYITLPMLKNFQVPVPSLEEQQRIVAILDKFDALVHGVSVGLPAEIEARRQQYEYYRDELLTFKELEVAS